jgi:hypothetical protein
MIAGHLQLVKKDRENNRITVGEEGKEDLQFGKKDRRNYSWGRNLGGFTVWEEG